MKITIDTKEDSHDDIKKVIRMLQNMVSHEGSNNSLLFSDNTSSDASSDSSEASSGSFFNMFGDNPSQDSPLETMSSPDETNEGEEEKVEDSIPELIPY